MHSLYAGALALAVLAVPNSERIDCGSVAGRYTAALARVIDAIRAYEKCVSQSEKRDDCAAEIEALDNAHDDFVDVVDDAKSCR